MWYRLCSHGGLGRVEKEERKHFSLVLRVPSFTTDVQTSSRDGWLSWRSGIYSNRSDGTNQDDNQRLMIRSKHLLMVSEWWAQFDWKPLTGSYLRAQWPPQISIKYVEICNLVSRHVSSKERCSAPAVRHSAASDTSVSLSRRKTLGIIIGYTFVLPTCSSACRRGAPTVLQCESFITRTSFDLFWRIDCVIVFSWRDGSRTQRINWLPEVDEKT